MNPMPVEPPFLNQIPVNYGIVDDREIQWTPEIDILLLSLIHVSKDGVGGFNDLTRLSWVTICERIREERVRVGDFQNYTPDNVRARWFPVLKDHVWRCTDKFIAHDTWGINADCTGPDVNLLRNLLHHSYSGGRNMFDPPLTWEQISEEMIRDIDGEFHGYTVEYISNYYFFHLAPRLLVVRREAGPHVPNYALEPRPKAPYPRIAYPELLGLEV